MARLQLAGLAAGLVLLALAGSAVHADPPVERCTSHYECGDGVFCNGEERCNPNLGSADERGCAPARQPACPEDETCDEANDRCLSGCDLISDEDGDGHDSRACGGDDCDDQDGDRFPGNTETCDEDGHDDDCDTTTYGDRDLDGDGHVDARCWNNIYQGTPRPRSEERSTPRLTLAANAPQCEGAPLPAGGR
ncbi:MAG: hypothetical protein GY937_28665 [bacterium]|nr:hypothetical protein [bacterium]